MSSDMKTKTTSAWIMHVKKFAKDNNIKYNEALRDPNLKVGYVKVERVKSSPKMSDKPMELNRNYDKVEPVMKVKKQRKMNKMNDSMNDNMLGGPSLLIVEPKPMIITESGNLEMKLSEPKKVKTKMTKKKMLV